MYADNKKANNRWSTTGNKEIVSDVDYCLVPGDEEESVGYCIQFYVEKYKTTANLFDEEANGITTLYGIFIKFISIQLSCPAA